MPADVIVAQPSTLTGSIGIFGGKFVTGGVYEKLGAHIESTSIGRHAEMNSPARPYNADERQESTRSSCRRSTTSSSRRSPSRAAARRSEIDQLAQGRVWTGQQAKENGLVDELGGLTAAIARREGAGEDSPRTATWSSWSTRRRRSFYELLSEQLSGSASRSRSAAWVAGESHAGELEALRAHPRAVRAVPARRSARADAVGVLAVKYRAQGSRTQRTASESCRSVIALYDRLTRWTRLAD